MRTSGGALTHRSVRSLSRGLALIQDLNMMGPSTVQRLAQRTRLNRTTCYRLLQTLQKDGFVAVSEENALFAPTPKSSTLSEGVSEPELAAQAAYLQCLTRARRV